MTAAQARRPARTAHADVLPVSMWVALLESAVTAGLDIRSALAAVGTAVAGADGAAMQAVAARLAVGLPWQDAWRGAPARFTSIEAALRPSWTTGASPVATLGAAAESLAYDTRRSSDRAIGELAVRMVLPLAFCLLPAFALVGLIPLVIAVASGLNFPALPNP